MKKTQRVFLILTILVLTTLACQATSGLLPTPTPRPVTPTTTATRTPHPTATATLTPSPTPLVIETESVRKMTSGGFNYAPLKYFDTSSNNHEISMTSPDESLFILLTARAAYFGEYNAASMRDYQAFVREQFKDVNFEDWIEISDKGADGITMNFSGIDGNRHFQARATYLRPPKGKLLLFLVYAYGEGTWDSLGEQTYQKIYDGISFFDIEPWSDCPIATKPSYGTIKGSPIKVGGKLLNGPELAEDYLSALLGKRGEVVSYYHVGAVEGGTVGLDEYQIHYGNQTRTLYIDIYNYEPPKAPTGMTCSGPFPYP